MVRDLLVLPASALALFGSCFTLAYLCFPEPAEVKLGRAAARAAQSIIIRTVLPAEAPSLRRCIAIWIGPSDPEIWCPAVPPLPDEQEQPAPTS